MLTTLTRPLLVLAGIAIAFAIGIACSDDFTEMTNRPEPPPPEVDGGGDGGDGGEMEGCPVSAPRVGEVCPRPEQFEQTCEYKSGGTCTVSGESVEKVDVYRCYMGTWHQWNGTTMCDP